MFHFLRNREENVTITYNRNKQNLKHLLNMYIDDEAIGE